MKVGELTACVTPPLDKTKSIVLGPILTDVTVNTYGLYT